MQPPERNCTHPYLLPLAGLCSMDRATQTDWSLDESVTRLKRIHYVLRGVHELLIARISGEPIYELKMLYSHHAYLCAEQVSLLRSRVGEMREPPLGLDKVPHGGHSLVQPSCGSSAVQKLDAPRGPYRVAVAVHGMLVAGMVEMQMMLLG